MKKISITYNPYLFKTYFVFSDRNNIPKQLEQYLDEPFDEIVEDIVSEMFDILNADYLINFKGRISEFEELESEVKKFNKLNNSKIELIHEKIIDDNNSIKDVKNIFNEIQSGPFEDLKTNDIVESFKKAIHKSDFNIGVVATMKAGKSTFLNSLLVDKLLPTKSEACTAKVFYIHNQDDMKSFNAEVFNVDDKKISTKKNVTDKDLKEYNANDNISYIRIFGDIKSIRSTYKNLVMIDTPGPNNASDDNHKKVTYNFLEDDDNSIVLYIIDGSVSTSEDNYELFKTVAELMNQKGKKSNERFIFVLNKIDNYDIDNGDDINEKIKSFKKDWEKDYGLKNPIIFPASAYYALIAQMKMNNKYLSAKESGALESNYFLSDLGPKIFEAAPVNKNIRNVLKQELSEAQKNEDIHQQMFLMSGIPAIEKYIYSFMDKYSRPFMIRDAINSFHRKLKEKNILEILSEEIQNDNQLSLNYSKNIDNLNNEIKKGNLASEIKKKIKDVNMSSLSDNRIKEFYTEFNNFKNDYLKLSGLNNDFDKSNVENYLNKFSKDLTNKFKKWKNMVEEILKSDLENNIKKLFNDYKNYTNNLIETGLNIDMGKSFLNDLYRLNIKSSFEEMIRDLNLNEEEDTIMVTKKRAWYNPMRFIFGDDYDTSKIILTQKYNKSEVVEKIAMAISPLNENMVKFDEEFKNSIIILKTTFINEIDKFEKKILDTSEKVKDVINKREKVEENKNKKEEKKKWLEGIVKKMDSLFYFS